MPELWHGTDLHVLTGCPHVVAGKEGVQVSLIYEIFRCAFSDIRYGGGGKAGTDGRQISHERRHIVKPLQRLTDKRG
jgi:hypothetical protein